MMYDCAGNDDEPRKAPAPGDPDFRWHASIPEKATLDYIKYVALSNTSQACLLTAVAAYVRRLSSVPYVLLCDIRMQ